MHSIKPKNHDICQLQLQLQQRRNKKKKNRAARFRPAGRLARRHHHQREQQVSIVSLNGNLHVG